MPNYTALTVAFLVVLGNRTHNLLDCKILLITADLFHIGIKENEIADQLKNTILVKQRDNVLILHGRNAACNQRIQISLHPLGILFFPHIPELLGCARGSILDCVLIGCQYDLGILEQLRNVASLLITNHLLNSLIHRNLRSLAFNYREGNAVDKQHNIRTRIVLFVLAFYGKLFRHMKYIVLRIVPINILQIETEHLPFANGLQIAFSQQQRIIDLLAGTHKTVG